MHLQEKGLTPINISNFSLTIPFTKNPVLTGPFLIGVSPLTSYLQREREAQYSPALTVCEYPEWTVNKVKNKDLNQRANLPQGKKP